MIYFIQNQRTLAVKIGFSDNVRARYRSLKTASSDTLKLLGTIPGDRVVERELHDRFSLQRLAGEWFVVNPELSSFIASCLAKRGGARPKMTRMPTMEEINDLISTACSFANTVIGKSTDLRFSLWINPLFDHRSESPGRAFFAVITIRDVEMRRWGEVIVHPSDEYRDIEVRIAEVVAEMDAGWDSVYGSDVELRSRLVAVD